MPTTPRKSTAKSAAAKLATPAAVAGPAEKPSDLDAMRGEVASEVGPNSELMNIADKPFPVPFLDAEIRLKAILDWPVSADKLLVASRFEEWAAKILDDGQFAEVWEPADPSLRQIIKFVGDLEAKTGIPFGMQFISPSS